MRHAHRARPQRNIWISIGYCLHFGHYLPLSGLSVSAVHKETLKKDYDFFGGGRGLKLCVHD